MVRQVADSALDVPTQPARRLTGHNTGENTGEGGPIPGTGRITEGSDRGSDTGAGFRFGRFTGNSDRNSDTGPVHGANNTRRNSRKIGFAKVGFRNPYQRRNSGESIRFRGCRFSRHPTGRSCPGRASPGRGRASCIRFSAHVAAWSIVADKQHENSMRGNRPHVAGAMSRIEDRQS